MLHTHGRSLVVTSVFVASAAQLMQASKPHHRRTVRNGTSCNVEPLFVVRPLRAAAHAQQRVQRRTELVVRQAVVIVRQMSQQQRHVRLCELAPLAGRVGGAVRHGEALAGGGAPAVQGNMENIPVPANERQLNS